MGYHPWNKQNALITEVSKCAIVSLLQTASWLEGFPFAWSVQSANSSTNQGLAATAQMTKGVVPPNPLYSHIFPYPYPDGPMGEYIDNSMR